MPNTRRIVICTSQIPFEFGGTEILTQVLHQELLKRGYSADVVRIPLRWLNREALLKSYLAWQMIDLTEAEGRSIDIVIPTKFPSFAVNHPCKITWLVQQFRQAYDLFGTEYSYLTTSAEDERLRAIIRHIDTRTLASSQRLFSISRNVAGRLAQYNGLTAEPLYPPPQYDGLYHNDGYGDYILSVARLNALKRVHLAVNALAYSRSPVRLVIVGQGDEEAQLKRLAQERRVAERVEFLGFVDRDHLIEIYANCLAVFYSPLDEDYGFATVEAFKSYKPILTARDSGGVLEFADNDVNGYIVDPDDPKALADCFDRLYRDRSLCHRLGEAGWERVQHITWDATVSRLLQD